MKKTRDEALNLQEVGDMEARWRGLATQLLELGDDAMDAQLLVAFRAAREEGVVPPDAGFFLVAHILTAMADEAIGDEPRVCRLALELELMEREYGVEQGVWLSGEETPPEDWEALRAAYEAACDEARATFFTAYGEEEMARLYLDDRICFHRCFESGRRFFHGLPMLPEHLH
ncbi:hypothetical protein BHS06_01610 [Myxococcus xanthus]|uniref:hypothetical protein n=1 Tax=Myxococcus xanthus TaxID=34 RepID=UPI00116209FA|nr:hypothetical protein [Myxococcus xanthus]QDE87741.1 hypothetical protein BHS06_01610 [Myxococcus xanthus]